MIAFRDEVEFSFFHLGRNPPLPSPPLPSPTAYDRDRKNSFGVNASSLSFSLNFEISSSVYFGAFWNGTKVTESRFWDKILN